MGCYFFVFSTTHENVVADPIPAIRSACSQDDFDSALTSKGKVADVPKAEGTNAKKIEMVSGQLSPPKTIAANMDAMMTRSGSSESSTSKHSNQDVTSIDGIPIDLQKRSHKKEPLKQKAAYCSSLNTLPRESKAAGHEGSKDDVALTRSATDSSICSFNPSRPSNKMAAVSPVSAGGEAFVCALPSSKSKSNSPSRELREATIKSLKCPYTVKCSASRKCSSRSDEIESFLSQEVSDKSSFGVMSSNIFMESEQIKNEHPTRNPKDSPKSPTVVNSILPCTSADSDSAYVSENISNEIVENLLSPSSSTRSSNSGDSGFVVKEVESPKTVEGFESCIGKDSISSVNDPEKHRSSKMSLQLQTSQSPVVSQRNEIKKSCHSPKTNVPVELCTPKTTEEYSTAAIPDNSEKEAENHTSPHDRVDETSDSIIAKSDESNNQVLQNVNDRKIEHHNGRRASLPSTDTLDLDKELQQLARSPTWICKKCTLTNVVGIQCAACGTSKGADVLSSGVVSKHSRSKLKKKPERPRSVAITEYWSCPLCTLQNPLYLHHCQACRWDKNNEHGVIIEFLFRFHFEF